MKRMETMLVVLLVLVLFAAPCFSISFCEIYFRRPCKTSCDSNENQLMSNIYCGTSTTGSACCVPGANPQTTTTTTTTPPPPPPAEGWGLWSNFGACTGSCTFAYKYRVRPCLSTTPCAGQAVDVQNCVPENCAVTGVTATTIPTTPELPAVSEWSLWSACSVSCGTGSRFRERTCNRPQGCSELLMETEECDYGACPEWNLWSMWSPCPVTCGGGISSRRRECIDGITSQTVTPDKCQGSDTETKVCNEVLCPDHECGFSGPSARVLNGEDAAKCRWPWMVHMTIPTFPVSSGGRATACSGVLVDKNSVVTTASCSAILNGLDTNDPQFKARITVADFDSSTADDVEVYFTEIVLHPDYVADSTSLEAAQLETNNLAVIQLDKDIEVAKGTCNNYVCLPDAYRNASHDDCVFAGWGLTALDGTYASVLQQAQANLQDITMCKFYYQWVGGYSSTEPFEDNFLCGSTPDNPTIACTGDDGGMLVCRDMSTGTMQWTLTGLSKPASCDASRPNLFVSIKSKMDWIRETIAKNG